VITFLEYFGAKLGAEQRKFSARNNPFNTKGNLRKDEGGITKISTTPQSRKHDSSLNGKVERLRIGTSTMEILSPVDVQEIRNTYNLSDLDESHPKQLSNMSIVVQFDPTKQTYILKRNV
jgi:hypothetical protein